MLQDCSVQLVGQGGTRLCSCRGLIAPAGHSGPQRVSRETRNPEDRDLMETLRGRREQFKTALVEGGVKDSLPVHAVFNVFVCPSSMQCFMRTVYCS